MGREDFRHILGERYGDLDRAAYEKGQEDGFEDGMEAGHNSGLREGYDRGLREGYDKATREILGEHSHVWRLRYATVTQLTGSERGNLDMDIRIDCACGVSCRLKRLIAEPESLADLNINPRRRHEYDLETGLHLQAMSKNGAYWKVEKAD